MPAWTALLLIAGLVVVVTLAGLLWRSRTGRVRQAARSAVTPSDLAAPAAFGERATLLQFSTEFCAPCRATRRLLAEVADAEAGVAHIEVDLTHRPDLASRFNILQTPTVLLLDGRGEVRGRIGGPPRSHQLDEHLSRILEGRNDVRIA